jgi:aminopeptidase N
LTDWSDIWLHEGFACYAEWLWSEKSGGPSAQDRALDHWRRLAAKPQDLILGDPGPDDMFDDRVYKRGALLLHALRLEVGELRFFEILREWVSRHAYGSVTTPMFTALVDEICGASLDGLFKDWLWSGALPALPR